MKLGVYILPDPIVFVAPMAGISDRPFRILCRDLGASAAVSEMVTADTRLWHSAKSRQRMDHRGESAPRIVQLLGNDPEQLAQAARDNVERGAQIIDLNLGCPAKKVCRRAAGSALLADEALVERLLRALTDAVSVPVTLKMRLGVDRGHINAARIARLAEAAGIVMVSVHGRTRDCAYRGTTDYEAIARVVEAVGIPVLANGDITTPDAARSVLARTGAAGVMIGRGVQGRPWLPGQIRAALANQPMPPAPEGAALGRLVVAHVQALHRHYGTEQGLRIARKHIGWYLERNRPEIDRHPLLAQTDAHRQLTMLAGVFGTFPGLPSFCRAGTVAQGLDAAFSTTARSTKTRTDGTAGGNRA